jgi:hypothetical protein
MAEHYTRNTNAVMKYCNHCGKNTMHKVSGKKLGCCLNEHAKPTVARVYEVPEPTLF